jgi:hypothetical protein
VPRNSSTGAKGVSRAGDKYLARGTKEGKRHFLGRFPSKEAAILATEVFNGS